MAHYILYLCIVCITIDNTKEDYDEKGKIIDFSQHEAKTIVDSMSEMIEKRATYIAESKYAEDLYVYFDSQGIV